MGGKFGTDVLVGGTLVAVLVGGGLVGVSVGGGGSDAVGSKVGSSIVADGSAVMTTIVTAGAAGVGASVGGLAMGQGDRTTDGGGLCPTTPMVSGCPLPKR